MWRWSNIKFFPSENDSDECKPITGNVWNPELGDVVEGKLINRIESVGKYDQNLYILLDKNDKEIKIWGKTQLDELMSEIEVEDYIRITYNGFKTTNNGHTMKVYYIERRETHGRKD